MGPLRVAFVLLGALVLTSAIADAKLGGARQANVVATTTATGNLRISARTPELRVDEDPAGVVTVTVPLEGLDTGIALRNRHLREKYLEASKYPNAELTVQRSALAFPAPGASASKSVEGLMRLHGASRRVMFSYTARREGTAYRVRGGVRVKINDYGVATPSFLGVTVKPEVEIVVDFVVDDS